MTWHRATFFNVLVPTIGMIRWFDVRKVNNVTHWTNPYPVDNAIVLLNTYTLDSDLSAVG